MHYGFPERIRICGAFAMLAITVAGVSLPPFGIEYTLVPQGIAAAIGGALGFRLTRNGKTSSA